MGWVKNDFQYFFYQGERGCKQMRSIPRPDIFSFILRRSIAAEQVGTKSHCVDNRDGNFCFVVMVNSWVNEQSRFLIGRSLMCSQSGARFAHWLTSWLWLQLKSSRLRPPPLTANPQPDPRFKFRYTSYLYSGVSLTIFCWASMEGVYVCYLSSSSSNHSGLKRVLTLYT